MNKLKQIMTANMMYGNDNESQLPRFVFNGNEGIATRSLYKGTPGYALIQGGYLGGSFSGDVCIGNNLKLFRNTFQCPSDSANYGYNSDGQSKDLGPFVPTGWCSYIVHCGTAELSKGKYNNAVNRRNIDQGNSGLVIWNDIHAGAAFQPRRLPTMRTR